MEGFLNLRVSDFVLLEGFRLLVRGGERENEGERRKNDKMGVKEGGSAVFIDEEGIKLEKRFSEFNVRYGFIYNP